MTLVSFTACVTETLPEEGNGKSIRILLNAQGDDVTRAISISKGNNAYGENTIATADVFFYTANGTLLYDVPKENVTLSAPDDKGVVTATVPMPANKNIDLTQASTVYVMGNRKATDTQVGDAKSSEDNLRALTFTTDLATVPTAETTFAMDGTGTITVTDNEISGHVELVRAAAKITLNVNIPRKLEIGDTTYEPQISKINVTFNNGVKNFGGQDKKMFNVNYPEGTAGDETTGMVNEKEVKIVPVTFDPFYSYPTTWEAGDDNEPYFTLHVPWGETNAEGTVASYTTYHYRVPINKTHFEADGKTLALKRNHWYQIDLTVGVLGTPEASDLVEVEGNYEVNPWGNLPIGTDLMDYKYLVVDQKEVEIFNQNTASVSFSSSHPITLEIVSIKKWDYSTANGTELEYVPSTTDKTYIAENTNPKTGTSKLLTRCEVLKSEDGKKIVLNHNLVNKADDSDNYDYVPYTITVNVSNGIYTEQITFVQYPEIYIVANRNSDYGELGEVTNSNSTHKDWNDNRNLFVNSYYTTNYSSYNHTDISTIPDDYPDTSYDDFGTATGLNTNFGNTNPNMYVIHVTSMYDNQYVIGDPREKDTNSDFIANARWAMAPAIYGTTPRKLSNYYRTDTSVETTNVIAPIYRVASSYSVASGVSTLEMAEKRCASYQEDGYPAGRWRVPTYAEVEFICRLSSEQKIPDLFYRPTSSLTIYYWCAHGKFAPSSNGIQLNPEASAETIRCVYDEWYWGSGQIEDKNTFTWGDQPR